MSDKYVKEGYSEGYVEGDSVEGEPLEVVCDLTSIMNELLAVKAQNSSIMAQNSAIKTQNEVILEQSEINGVMGVAIKAQNVELKQQNSDLISKLDTALSTIQSSNALNLSINSKLVEMSTVLETVPTTEYLESKIPFVDDKGLSIYPDGTEVMTRITHGVFVVESSKFLPTGDHSFTVVYTLSKEIDGEKQFSDFASTYVVAVDLEEWILKTDCPTGEGG